MDKNLEEQFDFSIQEFERALKIIQDLATQDRGSRIRSVALTAENPGKFLIYHGYDELEKALDIGAVCVQGVISRIKAQKENYRFVGESPHPDGDIGILACPCCGSGEYLHNEDGKKNSFCGQCGQAIDWGEEGGLVYADKKSHDQD